MSIVPSSHHGLCEPLEGRLRCSIIVSTNPTARAPRAVGTERRLSNASRLGLLAASVLSLSPAASAEVTNHVNYGASVILPESVSKFDNQVSAEPVAAGSGLLQSAVGASTASVIAFASAAPGHVAVSVVGTADVTGPGPSVVVAANASASWSETIEVRSFQHPGNFDMIIRYYVYLFGDLSATAGPFGAAHVTGSGIGPSFTVKTANVSGGPINQQPPRELSLHIDVENFSPKTLAGALSISGLAQTGSGHANFVGNFSNSLHWGGIISVEDALTGEIIDDWTIASESGADYARPIGMSKWNANSDGNWSGASNWFGVVPSAAGFTALLPDVITAPRVVRVDGDFTLCRLVIDSPQGYTLANFGGSLTLNNQGATADIKVFNGEHTVAVPVVLADDTFIDVADGARLAVQSLRGKSLAITHGLVQIIPNGTVNVGVLDVSGVLQVAGATDNNGQFFVRGGGVADLLGLDGVGDTTIDAAGRFSASRIRQTNLKVDGSASLLPVALGGEVAVLGLSDGVTTTTAGTLSLGESGRLDVNDVGIVVNYGTALSPENTIASALAAGRNVAPGGFLDGTWDGTSGIVSSVAAAEYISNQNVESLMVGFVDNANYIFGNATSFRGVPVGDQSILIGLTLPGDTNLDGAVNDSDLNALLANYGVAGSYMYYQGDINGDTIVDDTDLNSLLAFYGQSMPWYGQVFSGQPVGTAVNAVVPEPGTLSLLAIGVLGLLRRGRAVGRRWSRSKR